MARFPALVALLLLASLPARPSPVVEYYDAGRDRYFLTADPGEMAYVEAGGAGRGWVRTGYQFETTGPCASATPFPCVARPVCRFYGAPPFGSGSHFYTVDADECLFVREHDFNWVYEGIAFDAYAPDPASGACPAGTRPVFRSYNNGYAPGANRSNHRYAWDPEAQQRMVARGWKDEGIAFCAGSVRDDPLRSFVLRVTGDLVRSGPDCGAIIEERRACIGSNNIPGPRNVIGPFIADSIASAAFGARTGLASGTVYAVDGPGIDAAAANAFVQLSGDTTFGIHVDTHSRGGANLSNINPIFQFERFAPGQGVPDERVAPWAGQYDTQVEVVISFELRLKRLETSVGSDAYGHPTLDVFDRRSGGHLYIIVMTYGTVPAIDNVLRDGPDGNVIVATSFGPSQFGRRTSGETLRTPAPFISPDAQGTGGHFEFRFDAAEFRRILQAARTLEPGLSAEPADYFFDDYHFNNEIAGGGEIGLTLGAMTLELRRR